MKSKIFPVLAVAAMIAFSVVLTPLHAQGGAFLSKLRFSVESLPEQDGGGLKGNLGYKFSNSFSSQIYVKQLVTAETGELDLGLDNAGVPVAASSLNLLKSSITELFILPTEWNLGWNELTIGAGAYVSLTSMQNIGYFKLSNSYIAALAAATTPSIEAPETNYYDQASKARFFGPVLTAQAVFDLGFVSLTPKLVVVPFFVFDEEQSLEMNPYLTVQGWGKGSISYSSTGFPYIAVSAEDLYFPVGKLVGLDFLKIGGKFSFEMSQQNAQLITQNYADMTWKGTDANLTTMTLTYLAQIGIDLGSSSYISFGAGQSTTTSLQDNSVTATTAKPAFSLKYELRK
jgi:hypothetical protein